MGLVHDLIRRFHYCFLVSGKGLERCHLVSALDRRFLDARGSPQSSEVVRA